MNLVLLIIFTHFGNILLFEDKKFDVLLTNIIITSAASFFQFILTSINFNISFELSLI